MNGHEHYHNSVNPKVSSANQSIKQLMEDWDNRPSAFWGEDSAKRISNDIQILKALEEAGCKKTRDGLSVAVQLYACRNALRDIMRAQEG